MKRRCLSSPLSDAPSGGPAPSRNGYNVEQRSVFPGCCIERMQAKEMFSLLVQYNKLVSVLTGAPPAPLSCPTTLTLVGRSRLGSEPQTHSRGLALRYWCVSSIFQVKDALVLQR